MEIIKLLGLALFLGNGLTPQSAAQTDPHAAHRKKETTAPQAHEHSKMSGHGGNHGMNEAGKYLMNMASGTSMNPESWPMPMLMPRFGSWNVMLMGQAFLVATQQSGPRGGDKVYAPNWWMASAERKLGQGSFLFQTMLSLDPATVTHRSYPLLFQTGETAFGRPLVDAQHPHDFFMNIGMHYARPLRANTMLQLYYAPAGDPALGPVAFPHRASALELPQAILGHHWQDSTHIAANVATVALRHKWLRLEMSGFHGTEPDENRWNFDWGPMNSYAGRLSVLPSKNWMAQVSAGRLTQPEPQHQGDVVRTTASLHYTRPNSAGNAWSTSFIWGRNHDVLSGDSTDSALIETLYPLTRKNLLTGRFELADKNELFANDHDVEHQLEHTVGNTFRVQAYTAGYTRAIGNWKNVQAGLGASVTAYAFPQAIKPYYGNHPVGVNFFLRFRLKPPE